jgi:hypothetical protein
MKEAPARNSLPGFRFLLARSLDLPVLRGRRNQTNNRPDQ